MVQQIGAQAVSADVTNFGKGTFNGQVDIIGAPAAVFRPLELHKGLGTKGAIVNYPILQVTGQYPMHRPEINSLQVLGKNHVNG